MVNFLRPILFYQINHQMKELEDAEIAKQIDKIPPIEVDLKLNIGCLKTFHQHFIC